jgi:two-component system chemotaxis sensor kinase CheA
VAGDPYRYFRVEAREILDGLGRGVIQLEHGTTPQLASELLRLAHTLKGAARVVKQPKIAEEAHAVEEALSPLRAPGANVPRASVDRVLRLLDLMSAEVDALALAVTAPVTPPRADPASVPADRPMADDPVRLARADVAEMNALLDGVAEANVAMKSLRRTIGAVESAHHLAHLLAEQLAPARDAAGAGAGPAARGSSRERRQRKMQSMADELRLSLATVQQRLTEGVDQAERETKQVRDAAERLRLVPASALFTPLERAARDAAHTLGKSVTFEASGGDVRLDPAVLGAVQAALLQMVRNAVAHGIEAPEQRVSAGKPPAGRVAIRIFRRGGAVGFVCRDDGRGIDHAAVRRVARQRGLLPPAGSGGALGGDDAAPGPGDGDERLLQLLLKGGLTTASTVTELSGRGIGLDIVRETAERLKGEVSARTEAGRGTELELLVCVSLSSVDALLVEAGGIAAAIPLAAVRRTLRLGAGEVARTAAGESILHEGKVIPFVPLARSLRAKGPEPAPSVFRSAVVVDGNTALAAVGVDRLIGVANLVVRALPALAPADRLVVGAALDADGAPQLVLDPVAMVADIAALGGARAAQPAVRPPEARSAARVLVIDDSLTTRMLEQSILESAGYEVDLATCAEEGLEKARLRRYQLFLVDVEMPGMDGFTFVERTRADPALREVPAILVTSRDSAEDRRRGEQAGAHAHIIKSDFDQGQILGIIRKLVR